MAHDGMWAVPAEAVLAQHLLAAHGGSSDGRRGTAADNGGGGGGEGLRATRLLPPPLPPPPSGPRETDHVYVAEIVRLREELKLAKGRQKLAQRRAKLAAVGAELAEPAAAASAGEHGGPTAGRASARRAGDAGPDAPRKVQRLRKRTGGQLSDRTLRNLRYDVASFLRQRYASPELANQALSSHLATLTHEELDAIVPARYKTRLRQDFVDKIEELWDGQTALEIKRQCGLSDTKMDQLRRLLTKRYNKERDAYEAVRVYDVPLPRIASKRELKRFEAEDARPFEHGRQF